jgi:hypothetical protein
MIILFLVACGVPTTVQPLVDVRASEIAKAAAPGVRLAIASGSLGAWLCSLDQTDLRELGQDPDTGSTLPTIEAPAGFAANLGVIDAGNFFFNNETGVASMTFLGSMNDTQALSVEIEVDTPTREFSIAFRDPEGSPYASAAQVNVEDCAASPRVSVELELDDGTDEVRVVLPDSDGELLVWNSGQLTPRSGTASWSTGSGVTRQTWVGSDAEELVAELWPGRASSADWSADATVSIARPE